MLNIDFKEIDSLDENYKIYMHLNIFNNKVYIGQTKKNFNDRFCKDGKGYINNKNFYNDINKYGWNNFKHYCIKDNIKTQKETDDIEKYYINKYDSTNPDKGYNITEGGSGGYYTYLSEKNSNFKKYLEIVSLNAIMSIF